MTEAILFDRMAELSSVLSRQAEHQYRKATANTLTDAAVSNMSSSQQQTTSDASTPTVHSQQQQQPQQQQAVNSKPGTRSTQFAPTVKEIISTNRKGEVVYNYDVYHFINGMEVYQDKSFDELRIEDEEIGLANPPEPKAVFNAFDTDPYGFGTQYAIGASTGLPGVVSNPSSSISSVVSPPAAASPPAETDAAAASAATGPEVTTSSLCRPILFGLTAPKASEFSYGAGAPLNVGGFSLRDAILSASASKSTDGNLPDMSSGTSASSTTSIESDGINPNINRTSSSAITSSPVSSLAALFALGIANSTPAISPSSNAASGGTFSTLSAPTASSFGTSSSTPVSDFIFGGLRPISSYTGASLAGCTFGQESSHASEPPKDDS